MRLFILFALLLTPLFSHAQQNVKLAQMKYSGGGDWYANPTAIKNLSIFCAKNLNAAISPEYDYVEAGSNDVFNYPFIHVTGHGNIVLSSAEAENLRAYVEAGGFIHISDNYGLDAYVRSEFQKVLPNAEWKLVPFNHPIYNTPYAFKNGLPKIHEHEGSAPEGLGLFIDNRLVVFYDYECDLSDGWEDPEVHNDAESVRQKALQMGANLVSFAMKKDNF